MKERQKIINAIDDIVNVAFCDTVCEPICGRRKTLLGYEDKSGIPCARNSCKLFNDFANKAIGGLREVKAKV